MGGIKTTAVLWVFSAAGFPEVFIWFKALLFSGTRRAGTQRPARGYTDSIHFVGQLFSAGASCWAASCSWLSALPGNFPFRGIGMNSVEPKTP